MTIFMAVLLTSSMLVALTPSSASADDAVTLENWPVFRAGSALNNPNPCIASDGNGSVHLAYLTEDFPFDEEQPRLDHLRYSVYSDGTWDHTDVLIASNITDLDMALDEEACAHIIGAVRGDGITPELIYLNNTNGTWSSETAWHLDNVIIESLNMVLDQEGNVHLVMAISHFSDLDNSTYVYLSNRGGNWTSEPFYTFPRTDKLLSAMPEIVIDVNGNARIAYQGYSSYWWGDLLMEYYSIECTTRVAGEWTDNVTLPMMGYWCDRFSLQVDADGKERVLYHRVINSWTHEGPVIMAQREDVMWSETTLDHGNGWCQLLLDEAGDEHIVYRDLYQHLVLGESSEGNWSFRTLNVPPGVEYMPGDIRAGTGDNTTLVFYDEMTGEVMFSRPSDNPQLFPEFTAISQDESYLVLSWNATDPQGGPAIAGYLIHRWSPWQSFMVGANVTELTDDDFGTPYYGYWADYRISVLTAAGEEYIGGSKDVFWTIEDSQGGFELDWEFIAIWGKIALEYLIFVVIFGGGLFLIYRHYMLEKKS